MHSGAYRVIETHCRGDYYIRHSIHVPKNIALRLYSSAEVPATPALTVGGSSNSGRGCSKCGTAKKSGERSCCARGGTWFKNCGDAGNAKFDHTWAEGIRACKGSSTLVSMKSPLQVMLRHVGGFVDRGSTAQALNITQNQATIAHTDKILNVNSKVCVGIAKVVVCICVVCLASHLQTKFH